MGAVLGTLNRLGTGLLLAQQIIDYFLLCKQLPQATYTRVVSMHFTAPLCPDQNQMALCLWLSPQPPPDLQ